MNDQIMEIIQKEKYNIPLATQKFILQMGLAQWDGQWFLKSKKKYGVKEANELNQKIAFSAGKIEARHVINALGIRKGSVDKIPEIFKIINTVMEVMIPKIMRFKLVIHSDKEGDIVVKKCFIWEEVRKSKGEKEYYCACHFRQQGWMEALGINAEITPIKRIPNGDENCLFKFILK